MQARPEAQHSAAPPEAGGRSLRLRSGELNLAVRIHGEDDRPTLLLLHGYPDCSRVWDRVLPLLLPRYRVITYDVRGAGASDAPKRIRDYRMSELAGDMAAVLAAASPERPVHLVAHDWGSIQSWEALADPRLAGRIASFSSISGPCLDHASHWIRRRLASLSPRAMAQALGQLLRSWYMFAFQLPLLMPLLWRFLVGPRWPALLARLEGTRAEPVPSQIRDGVNGINLYRANLIPRLLRPRARRIGIPVQLIVPLRDRFVQRELLDEIPHWVPRLWRRELDAGHWAPLSHPAEIARLAAELADCVDGGRETPALQAARVTAGPAGSG